MLAQNLSLIEAEEELLHTHDISCGENEAGIIAVCRHNGTLGLRWLKRLLRCRWLVLDIDEYLLVQKAGDLGIFISNCKYCCHKLL